MTKITVIIPVSSGHVRYILNTLLSLEEGIRKPDEVILITPSMTAKYLMGIITNFKLSFEVKIIEMNEPGIGIARKAGIDMAKGDIIAFIDADEIAHPAWLSNIERHITNDRPIIAGRIEYIDEDILKSFLSNVISQPLNDHSCHEIEFASTANLAFMKFVINEVGNFDPEFIIGYEDTDFIWRIQHRGLKVWLCNDIVTYHVKRSEKFNVRRSFDIGLQTSILFLKHPGKTIKKLMKIPLGYIVILIISILLIIKGDIVFPILILISPLIYELYRCFRRKYHKKVCLKFIPTRILDQVTYGLGFILGLMATLLRFKNLIFNHLKGLKRGNCMVLNDFQVTLNNDHNDI